MMSSVCGKSAFLSPTSQLTTVVLYFQVCGKTKERSILCDWEHTSISCDCNHTSRTCAQATHQRCSTGPTSGPPGQERVVE